MALTADSTGSDLEAAANSAIADAESGRMTGVTDASGLQDGGTPQPVAADPINDMAALAGQPAAAGTEQWESVLDFARANGYDTSQYQDERVFLNDLLASHRQRGQEDFYAQLGRQLQPHVEQFNQYLQTQNQPKNAAPPEWQAPQFDPRWMGLVEREPLTGIYIGKPGTPAAIVDGVNKYDAWHQKYGSDPLASVRPYFEQAMPDLVNKAVGEQLSKFRNEQAVRQIVQNNSGWMYQAGPDGRVQYNQQGQPIATPAGARYGQMVRQLEGLGMRDPYAVDDLARRLVIGEMAQARIGQSGNQPPALQQRHASASGRPQTNPNQSRGPLNSAMGQLNPDQDGVPLMQRMYNDLEAAGLGDESHFRNFFANI